MESKFLGYESCMHILNIDTSLVIVTIQNMPPLSHSLVVGLIYMLLVYSTGKSTTNILGKRHSKFQVASIMKVRPCFKLPGEMAIITSTMAIYTTPKSTRASVNRRITNMMTQVKGTANTKMSGWHSECHNDPCRSLHFSNQLKFVPSTTCSQT